MDILGLYRRYSVNDFVLSLFSSASSCTQIIDEEQRLGFYSLEMAADLELEPKPYHIIGFEDTNDCKNLCYIIQAQMEMLGNGHASVGPQPPKVRN